MSDNMERAEEYLRKFPRDLPVVLNDHELQTYGKMLAEKCKEQELALERKKQVVADHTNRIKVITNEIKRIADARAKGEELRPVTCAERLHGNVIEIVRLDRGEVVDSRPAELRDLQTSIPGTEIPDDFDEGPAGDDLGGDDMGGPDKTGRSNVVHGEFGKSSVGDVVYNGAPNDVDEEIDDGGPGDEEPAFPEFDGAAGEPEEDEIDQKLKERDSWKQAEADADLAERKKIEQRDKDQIARLTKEQEGAKPKRERSKAKNGAAAKAKRKK